MQPRLVPTSIAAFGVSRLDLARWSDSEGSAAFERHVGKQLDAWECHARQEDLRLRIEVPVLLVAERVAARHVAVNPNARTEADTRTPEELLDIIEARGREVDAAIAELRVLLAD